MRRQQRGFTLIEMTVALTVLSLIWLSVTCVLHTLYRADHRLRDELQSEHALDRFAVRLRLDSHAASSANLLELAEGGDELVLSTSNERSIHYGTSDNGVYRVVRQGEAVMHRDTFLVGRVAAAWHVPSTEGPPTIVVTLTSRSTRSLSTRVRQVKAAVATAHEAAVGEEGSS